MKKELTHKEVKKMLFAANPELKKAYEELAPEYEIVRQVIEARTNSNMTQKELADRIGTKQCNISRLESGGYNPSLAFLKKVAAGVGKQLHIEFR